MVTTSHTMSRARQWRGPPPLISHSGIMLQYIFVMSLRMTKKELEEVFM